MAWRRGQLVRLSDVASAAGRVRVSTVPVECAPPDARVSAQQRQQLGGRPRATAHRTQCQPRLREHMILSVKGFNTTMSVPTTRTCASFSKQHITLRNPSHYFHAVIPAQHHRTLKIDGCFLFFSWLESVLHDLMGSKQLVTQREKLLVVHGDPQSRRIDVAIVEWTLVEFERQVHSTRVDIL